MCACVCACVCLCLQLDTLYVRRIAQPLGCIWRAQEPVVHARLLNLVSCKDIHAVATVFYSAHGLRDTGLQVQTKTWSTGQLPKFQSALHPAGRMPLTFCRALHEVALVRSLDLSNPKLGHIPGGSVRGGARRDGGAERGRAAQDADGIVRPRENSPSYPPDDGRMSSWVFLWTHEQRKTYVTRWGNKAASRDEKRLRLSTNVAQPGR